MKWQTASPYLVVGSESALLVDTGMTDEALLPVLAQLIDKIITLLITHGHGDHMRYMNQFENVYMEVRDVALLSTLLKCMNYNFEMDFSIIKPQEDNQTISLGDISVKVLAMEGHSPGSVLFYEENRHLLFTGDAVGSGGGVWMQLPGSASITTFRQNLLRMDALWSMFPNELTVLPGHYDQQSMLYTDLVIN